MSIFPVMSDIEMSHWSESLCAWELVCHLWQLVGYWVQSVCLCCSHEPIPHLGVVKMAILKGSLERILPNKIRYFEKCLYVFVHTVEVSWLQMMTELSILVALAIYQLWTLAHKITLYASWCIILQFKRHFEAVRLLKVLSFACKLNTGNSLL